MKRLAVQWSLLFIASGVYAWFAIWNVWPAINSNDFKHIFFGMKALLDTSSPYPIQSLHHQAALQGYQGLSFNPYVYLPFTGHAMAFLAPFRLDHAVAIWFLLNHFFVAGSVHFISYMFPRWRVGAAGVLLLSLAFSTPLYRTLTAGQLNVALLFLICLSLHLAKQQKSLWCGTVIAFAALYKLMPGLYGLYFLLRRQYLTLAAMVLSGLVMLGVSVAWAGPRIYGEFWPVLRQMGYGSSTWPHVFSFWDDPPNQSFNSFYSHIFTINDHTTPWATLGQSTANLATIIITTLLFSAYLFVLVAQRKNKPSSCFSNSDEGAWVSTLILALLLPSLLWDHYLVMLILPTAWIVKVGLRINRPLAVMAAVLCYGLTCIPWNFVAPPWRAGVGIFLMSMKLWPTIVLFGLSLCFTQLCTKEATPAHMSEPGI